MPSVVCFADVCPNVELALVAMLDRIAFAVTSTKVTRRDGRDRIRLLSRLAAALRIEFACISSSSRYKAISVSQLQLSCRPICMKPAFTFALAHCILLGRHHLHDDQTCTR